MSATPLYQLAPGAVDYRVLASLATKTFDEIAAVKNDIPREGSKDFQQLSTNLETYKIGEIHKNVKAVPKNEETSRVPLISPLEGYNNTATMYTRRLGFIATRQAFSRQKINALMQVLNSLPECAQVTEELAYADMFNKAFATNTGGDGSYVFATDHYYADAQYGQWSNTAASSAAFTTDTFFLGWLNLMTRRDASYNPCAMVPERVSYHPTIQEAVSKVHNSSQYPQNSLNAKMDPLFSAWEMDPRKWQVSTTAWFVHARVDESKKGLKMVWETKPLYEDLKDGMNPAIVMGKALEMSFGTVCVIARDWYSNAGA